MFGNNNIARKYYNSTPYRLDSDIVRPPTERSQFSIKIIQWIKSINIYTPSPTNMFWSHASEDQNIYNMSLVFTQKKTNKTIHKFQYLPNKITNETTHTLQQKTQVQTYMKSNKIFTT